MQPLWNQGMWQIVLLVLFTCHEWVSIYLHCFFSSKINLKIFVVISNRKCNILPLCSCLQSWSIANILVIFFSVILISPVNLVGFIGVCWVIIPKFDFQWTLFCCWWKRRCGWLKQCWALAAPWPGRLSSDWWRQMGQLEIEKNDWKKQIYSCQWRGRQLLSVFFFFFSPSLEDYLQ